MSFAHPSVLIGLLLVPAALAAWFVGQRRGERRTAAFGRRARQRRPYGAAILLSLAAIAAILAAAQPRWGEKPSRIGRVGTDLVVVLDISRSMDATDVQPTRLEASKAAVNSIIDHLGGGRIGLVVFAGSARLRFPLTGDYAAAKQVVASVETRQLLVQPGTSVRQGLERAIEAFDLIKPAGRTVLIMTDGENLADDPSATAQRLHAAGIDLLVAGVGSAAGAAVPVTDPVNQKVTDKLDANGNPVVTRLDETFLKALAGAAGGRYLGHDSSQIAGLVEGRLGALKAAQLDDQATMLPVERYRWFAAGALALALLASVAEHLRAISIRRAALVATVIAALGLAGCASAAYDANEAGRAAYQRGDFATAVQRFSEAATALPDDDQAALNLAAALGGAKRYDEAVLAARRATVSNDLAMRGRAFAAIGHQEFAAGHLPEALAAFKQALEANQGDDASRHDYEVVLRMMAPVEKPPSDQPPQDGGPPPAGQGQPGEAGATPPPGGPPGPQPSGTPQAGSGTPQAGDGGRPASAEDINRRLAGIDGQVNQILEAAGDQPTPDQALQILRLLAERSRLAAQRDASLSGGGPTDY